MKRLFSDKGLRAVQNDEPWKQGVTEVNCWSGEQGVDGTQSTGLLRGGDRNRSSGRLTQPKAMGQRKELHRKRTPKHTQVLLSLLHTKAHMYRVRFHKAWQRAAGSCELIGSWSSRAFSIISRASTATFFPLQFTHPTQRISFTPTAPPTLVTSKTVP